MHQCIKFILFWNDMTHYMFRMVFLSIIRSSKTVHTTTGICQSDTAVCCMYSLELLMMDANTVRNT